MVAGQVQCVGLVWNQGESLILALLWSGDDGAPNVMPLPRGIAEDSSTATYSTVLHLWVKASLLWPTMVVYVDVTFLVEGDVPMAIYVPDATLSSPCPLHPLLSLSFLVCASLLLAPLLGETGVCTKI